MYCAWCPAAAIDPHHRYEEAPSATSASPRTDSIIWLSSLESLEKLRLTTVCGVDIMQGDAVALKKDGEVQQTVRRAARDPQGAAFYWEARDLRSLC